MLTNKYVKILYRSASNISSSILTMHLFYNLEKKALLGKERQNHHKYDLATEEHLRLQRTSEDKNSTTKIHRSLEFVVD